MLLCAFKLLYKAGYTYSISCAELIIIATIILYPYILNLYILIYNGILEQV